MSEIVGQTKEDCEREYGEQFEEAICSASDQDECRECILGECPFGVETHPRAQGR